MKRLSFLLLALPLWAQPNFVDPHYTADLIFSGNGMTVLDFDSSGRLYIGEKRGRIWILQPDGSGGFLPESVFADLSSQVDFSDECGLLGMAVDPNFAANRHIYLSYTTPSDSRITRITANASFTAMEPGSEIAILPGLPRLTTIHKAGDLRFHPQDPETLFTSIGDDDLGHISTGGVFRVQDPDFYEGKILRISKDNGQGLDSNPYWDGDPTSVRSRVWAVGFRNPFRFAFHPNPPNPDVIYVSENGDATDRVSWALRGSNGEWNGMDINGNGFGFLNPTDPNHRILTTLPPSLIGILVADSGPFAPGGPTLYVANWLSGIRRWHLTGPDLDTATPIASDMGQVFTGDIVGTDLKFGPDGHIYASWSGGGESLGDFYTVWRIRFSGVDPPNAAFTTTPAPPTGTVPLEVMFTDASSAPGSTIVQRQWDFGDGTTSQATNPTHTYANPGVYTASLRVENTEGLSDIAEINVTASRMVNVVLDGTIFDGRTLPATPLAANTDIRFFQLTGEPIPIAGGIGPDGNGLAVSAGVITGSLMLPLTGPGFLMSAGEPTGDGVLPATIGIEAPPGQASIAPISDFYLSDFMIRGQVTDHRHQPITTDLGLARTSPENWVDIAGGRDILPGSGIPLTGRNHRRDSDAFGYFHMPVPTALGAGTYFLQAVGDTQEHLYAQRTITTALTDEQVLPIQLSQFSGGIDCDDLSSIAETPNVDYDTQIQPIWNTSCTGCHSPGTTNSGGLDLTPANSLANLVGAPSTFAQGLLRVASGHPNRSYLFEKVNCANPQTGNRMRPTNAMSLANQALIRDWIEQLDNTCTNQFLAQLPNWPTINILALMNFVCP